MTKLNPVNRQKAIANLVEPAAGTGKN